jgi:hypothetical protein
MNKLLKFRGKWYKRVKQLKNLTGIDTCYGCAFNGMNCLYYGIECNQSGLLYKEATKKNVPSRARVHELEEELEQAYKELYKLRAVVNLDLTKEVFDTAKQYEGI